MNIEPAMLNNANRTMPPMGVFCARVRPASVSATMTTRLSSGERVRVTKPASSNWLMTVEATLALL